MGRRIELGHRPPVAGQQAHPRLAQCHGGETVGQEGGVVGRPGAAVAGGDLHPPDRSSLELHGSRGGSGRAGASVLSAASPAKVTSWRSGGRLQAGAQPAGVAGEGPHGERAPGHRVAGVRGPRRRVSANARRAAAPSARQLSSRARAEVANRLERLQLQGRLAGQHAAGGGSSLLDGAVHPRQRPGAIALQRPEGVDGGGVVPRSGEPLAHSRRSSWACSGWRPRSRRVTASAKSPERRAMRRARSRFPASSHCRTTSPGGEVPGLGHLGGEEEPAVPLQEAHRLLVSVEDLGEQEGGLLDPLLGLQALEGLAVEPAQLAVDLGGDAGHENQGRETLRADVQLGARREGRRGSRHGRPPRRRQRARHSAGRVSKSPLSNISRSRRM